MGCAEVATERNVTVVFNRMQERHKLVISEYKAAKEEAVAAKAVRDKARQQHAGNLIRDLKQEMACLGDAHCP